MTDYIIPKGIAELTSYLRAISPARAKFMLVAETDDPDPVVWKTLTDYLTDQPEVDIIREETKPALITLVCPPDTIRDLLDRPYFLAHLISISTPPKNELN